DLGIAEKQGRWIVDDAEDYLAHHVFPEVAELRSRPQPLCLVVWAVGVEATGGSVDESQMIADRIALESAVFASLRRRDELRRERSEFIPKVSDERCEK